MALGIDLYRYQTVTDWSAVKRTDVSFVYVKGTDGAGQASVHADGMVAGAKSVGIPVGLYHYAELTPSAEVQADVLAAEVDRLQAAGIPPALDLEGPWTGRSDARSFAIRFLTRLKTHFPTVTLYANTSMLAAINADTLGVPGVKIWAARYGANNGGNNGLGGYAGHVDIHQYTSTGRVNGISGAVDMNESLTDITGGDDMATPQELWEGYQVQVLNPDGTPNPGYKVQAQNMLAETNRAAWTAVTQLAAITGALSDTEAAILTAVRAQPTGGQVDVPTLSAALTASLGHSVAAELGRILTEGTA